jgi:hypothetical protein
MHSTSPPSGCANITAMFTFILSEGCDHLPFFWQMLLVYILHHMQTHSDTPDISYQSKRALMQCKHHTAIDDTHTHFLATHIQDMLRSNKTRLALLLCTMYNAICHTPNSDLAHCMQTRFSMRNAYGASCSCYSSNNDQYWSFIGKRNTLTINAKDTPTQHIILQ